MGGPNGGAAMTRTINQTLLKRDGEELFQPGAFSVKKDLIAYFSDCPELAQKIETKIFKKRDLLGMVMYYNENCE